MNLKNKTPDEQDNEFERRKLQEQMIKAEEISKDDIRFVEPELFERNNLSVRKGYTNELLQ